jgi:hypothetical protein
MAHYQTPLTAIDVDEIYSELSAETQERVDDVANELVDRMKNDGAKIFGENMAQELFFALVRKKYIK